MKTHFLFYEKQKQQQSPVYDKSTVYNGSKENPEEHPNFFKQPKKNNLFNVIVLPVCLWLVVALLSAKYNIAQGDLKPHKWELMNTATAILFMYWSAKVFDFIVNKSYKNSLTQKLAGLGMVMCFIAFISSGLYLVKIIVELIKNWN